MALPGALSRGGWLGLHVLQQLLTAGGGAVLVHDGLGLSHQEVGEQDAARLEHLCKTANTQVPQVNINPEQESQQRPSSVARAQQTRGPWD